MSALDEIDEKPPEHWGELIAYLSMDATDPFWPALGYAPPMLMDAVRSDLRKAIGTLRERAAGAEAMPDIRALVFDENAMGWSEEALEGLAELGLYDFAANHADAPHVSGWQIALTYFPDEFPRTREALAAENGAEVAENVIAARDGFDEAIDQPKKLSAWDLQLCARHGWNPEDEAMFPPFDALSIAVSLRGARKALATFAASASPKAQATLHAEAQELLERFEVWMPGPLEPLMLKVDHAPH